MEDFPDRLSPILVKELRQGMRGRVFIGSLVLLQVAMVFLSIFGLSAATAGAATEEFGAMYWALVGIPLLVVLPAAGLGAVAGERTANTLELLFLTRLTARRILLGKWLALLIQALLLVCAVVPYGVLRYFLGSVSLAQELVSLGTMLFVAAILSALAVGCSPLPVWVTRVIAILGVLFGVWIVPALLITRAFGRSMGISMPMVGLSAAPLWLFFILAGVVLIAVALEFGAGRIAPPSENHSTPIRLLALGSLGAATALCVLWPSLVPAPLVLAYLLARAVCVGVMCESPRLIPALYRPFVRKGFAGRALGSVLYPGWPSGVFFTLLAGFLYLVAGGLLPEHAMSSAPVSGLAALLLMWVDLGVVLVPFAFLRLAWPDLRFPFVGFILVQLGTYLLFSISALVKVVAPAADPSFLFKLVPLYGLTSYYARTEVFPFIGVAKADPNLFPDLLGAAAVTALAVALLMLRMRRPWREIAACEAQAAVTRPPGA